jgi:predicted ABC-type ATPase
LKVLPLRPEIVVLAGVNGAGKSSIGGAALRQAGSEYFNPDEAARLFRGGGAGVGVEDANSLAWRRGKELLERAIEHRLRFALETTLGGDTITRLLLKAANVGLPVRVWYVGLEGEDLHVQRVRARVARGGHDIPEAKIKERYQSSRLNLLRLLPHLSELKLYDNSHAADPAMGEKPVPLLILHLRGGVLRGACALNDVPVWAKPIVRAVVKLAVPS